MLVGAVLGAVGFVAAAAVGLRRRRTEVAALRATGLSRRQVAGSLALERLGLLAVALLLGRRRWARRWRGCCLPGWC